MFSSAKYSFLALKLGLAAVFLWFGIDKFLYPSYWLNAPVLLLIDGLTDYLKISAGQLVYLSGFFEILVAISLIAWIFPKFFSALAVLFLVAAIVFGGLNEAAVSDLALIGGLVAVFLWPARERF